MQDWAEIFLAIITALGVRELLSIWAAQRARRHVTDAEARKTNAEAELTAVTASEKTLGGAFALLTKVRERQDELEAQNCVLEDRMQAQSSELQKQSEDLNQMKSALGEYARRVIYLNQGVALLLREFIARNLTPPWTPDEWTPPSVDKKEPL